MILNIRILILFFLVFGNFAYATTETDINGLVVGEWYEITNEDFTDVYCHSAYGNCWADETEPDSQPASGGGGPYAYSGGVYDSTENRIIIWGGGHWDWGGNEVYGFDFDTYEWELIWAPSSYDAIVACDGDNDCDNYYAANEPESRHTYKHLAYDPIGNRLFSAPTRVPYGPIGTTGAASVDFFDFDTSTWTDNGDLTDHPSGGMSITICDSESGDCWAQEVSTTAADQDLYQYEPDTDTWTKRDDDLGFGALGNTPIPFSGAFDPVKKIFLIQGNGVYKSINVSTPSSPVITSAYTGDSTLVDMTANPGADIVFDPNSGLFFGWAADSTDNTDIFVLNPSLHVWTKVEVPVGNSVTPLTYTGPGIYGRFQVISELNEPLLHVTYWPDAGGGYKQYVNKIDYASIVTNEGVVDGDPVVLTNIDAIEFRWQLFGDADYDATCTVQYKKTTDGEYSDAQNLFRFRKPVDTGVEFNELSGNIMFLDAETTYDIILTMSDPDGGSKIYTGQATTKSLPVRPVGGDTWYGATDGSGTTCGEGTPCAISYLNSTKAQPGDIIKLKTGSYTGTTSFNKDGTIGNYIVWEEYGDGDVIIAYANITGDYNWFSGLKFDADLRCGVLVADDADYGVIEGTTVTGGSLCGACGGAVGCDDTKAYLGFVFSETSDGWFIYNNTINGDRTIESQVTTSEGDTDTVYISGLTGFPDEYFGMDSDSFARSFYNPRSGAIMIIEPGHDAHGEWKRIDTFNGTTGQCEIARELYFNSGGTYEIVEDDVIEGETSETTATVHRIKITSGSWAGGDAAGVLILYNDQAGDFQAETIKVGANSNVATLTSGTVSVFSAAIGSGVAVAVWLNAAFSPEGIELNKSDDHAIYDNTITGVGDGISYPGSNVSIFGNDIYANHDDGMEADFAEVNFRFYQNKVTTNTNNLSLQDGDNGSPWWIVKNQFVMGWDSGAIKIRTSVPQFLFHNTFIQWDNFLESEPRGARSFIAKNNIVVLYDGGQFWDFEFWENYYYTDIDYNIYDDNGTDATPWFYTASYTTMAEWTVASGHDTNSIQEDRSLMLDNLPVFTYQVPPVKNIISRDWITLKSGSSAIDAGAVLNNINDGYLGSAPDIGIFEYINLSPGEHNITPDAPPMTISNGAPASTVQ